MKTTILILLFAVSSWAQYSPSASGSTTAAAEINSKPAIQSAAANASGNCTAGKDLWINTATQHLQTCIATNVWSQPGGSGLGIPLLSTLGSMVVTGAQAADVNAPFSVSKFTCAAGKNTFWPVAGYFVSPTVAFAATQNAIGTIFPSTNCGPGGTIAPFLGTGVQIVPGTAAGAYTDPWQYDAWHGGVGSQISMGDLAIAGSSASMTFVADSGTTPTVLGATIQTTLTASSTQFWSFGSFNATATELPTGIPIPFAYTLSNFVGCDSTAPSATVAVNLRVNSASVGTPGNIGFTLPTGTVGCTGWDGTNTYTGSAGDYVDVQTVSGSSTQTSWNWMAVAVSPTSGTPEMIWGIINNTITTTQSYSQPETQGTSGTFTTAQAPMSRGCTASNLYVVQATANGASPVTTFTLYQNGSPTALTGTVNQASGTGSLLLDGTHTVALAQNDRIALGYITNTGTSGTIAGWAFKCQ